MKMKLYYVARQANTRVEDCEMLAGPMSYIDAYTHIKATPELYEDYPKYVFVVSRLVDVED